MRARIVRFPARDTLGKRHLFSDGSSPSIVSLRVLIVTRSYVTILWGDRKARLPLRGSRHVHGTA